MITKKITIHNEEYEISASTIRALDALEKHLVEVISLRGPKMAPEASKPQDVVTTAKPTPSPSRATKTTQNKKGQ